MSENTEKKQNILNFEKDLAELKKKYDLDPVATIEFPQYRVLPDEVLLALRVIERHQYKIMLSYKEK
jgi:hypothetical protein